MATIYGIPQAEKEMIKKCPFEIEGFESFEEFEREIRSKIAQEKTLFFKKLPQLKKDIQEEISSLKSKEGEILEGIELLKLKLKKELEKKKQVFYKDLSEEVEDIKSQIKKEEVNIKATLRKSKNEESYLVKLIAKYKSDRKWSAVLINHFKLLGLKLVKRKVELSKINRRIKRHERKLSELQEKPLERFNKIQKDLLDTIYDAENVLPSELILTREKFRAKEEGLKALNENPEEFFNEENSEILEDLQEIEKFKKTPDFTGALGEIRVLRELSKLGKDYHILCGLNINLDKYTSFNGHWDLKSAQMDFVVVCPKGVFVIEVKNWSSSYYKGYRGLSPHEQVARAGRVIYLFLRAKLGTSFSVGTILVPVQNNIDYKKGYSFVWVSKLYSLISHLENKKEVLERQSLKRIINKLQHYVTYK